MLRFSGVLLLLSFCGASVAQNRSGAPVCPAPEGLSAKAMAFFSAWRTSDIPCASKRTVFQKLALSNPPGGRKLEQDKAFDQAAAERDLATAMKDPEIRKRLDEARNASSDDAQRLAAEAAILDDEGRYAARDLKIRLLADKLP